MAPLRTLQEGSASLLVPKAEKISRKMQVFYNPVMKLNRDITILLLKQFPPLHLCDPLAGTGVRSIRFAQELQYKSITANDIGESAFQLIKKNMNLNNVSFSVENKDAALLLLQSKGFDYIDLDVFGSPNFLLDSSIKRLSRTGILAVTATDTAPLAGTYPKACMRKYWAVPKKDSNMHETGIRILIRKAQLIGAQYDKALLPIFSYFKDHYYRVFFRVEKAKKEVDLLLKQHGMHGAAGPLWLGNLWDSRLTAKMAKTVLKEIEKDIKNAQLNKKLKINKKETTNDISVRKDKERGNELLINNDSIESKNILPNHKKDKNGILGLLKCISNESKIQAVGFHHLPSICRKYKLSIPKREILLKELNKSHKAAETHFTPEGIRSSHTEEEIKNFIRRRPQRNM